jgi:hypothetical protein
VHAEATDLDGPVREHSLPLIAVVHSGPYGTRAAGARAPEAFPQIAEPAL